MEGREEPFSAEELAQLTCIHCGKEAETNTYGCADALHRPACQSCLADFVKYVRLHHFPLVTRGRKYPYPGKGAVLRGTVCAGCRKHKARYEWNINHRFRAICPACDILLNKLYMQHFSIPEREKKLAAYSLQVYKDNSGLLH